MTKETVEIMIGNEIKAFNLKIYSEEKVYGVAVNEKKILIGDGMLGYKIARALYQSIIDELKWPSEFKPKSYVHEFSYLESITDLNGVLSQDLKKYNKILDYIEQWS